jgi:adenylate kinase family enzyme
MANLSEANLSENECIGAAKSLIQDKSFKLGHRIVVVGTTGSGKTTLAGELAQQLEVQHVELDALHWEPNWAEAPIEIFRERVAHAVSGEAWVTDGNYSAVRDIVWSHADTIVWLDYSLPTILYRLTRRTFRRVFTREELWSGNKERMWVQFLSHDSIFLWALKTYRRRRREYPKLLSAPGYTHLHLVHLYSSRQARRFFRSL